MKYIIFSFLIIMCCKSKMSLAAYVIEEDISTTSPTNIDNFGQRSSLENFGKIFGGRKTPITKVPYVAALLINGSLLCGAGIISSWYIVTAGLCLYNMPEAHHLSVRTYSSFYEKEGYVRGISYYAIHPKYRIETSEYNVAVVRANDEFNVTIPKTQLKPSLKSPHTGYTLLVSGWGEDSYKGGLSKELKSVNVTVMDSEKCNETYQQYGMHVPKTGFCATNYPVGDPCRGDLGGPAVNNGTIFGIVAAGLGCEKDNFRVPSLYTDISKVIYWIEFKIKDDFFDKPPLYPIEEYN